MDKTWAGHAHFSKRKGIDFDIVFIEDIDAKNAKLFDRSPASFRRSLPIFLAMISLSSTHEISMYHRRDEPIAIKTLSSARAPRSLIQSLLILLHDFRSRHAPGRVTQDAHAITTSLTFFLPRRHHRGFLARGRPLTPAISPFHRSRVTGIASKAARAGHPLSKRRTI